MTPPDADCLEIFELPRLVMAVVNWRQAAGVNKNAIYYSRFTIYYSSDGPASSAERHYPARRAETSARAARRQVRGAARKFLAALASPSHTPGHGHPHGRPHGRLGRSARLLLPRFLAAH